MFEFYFQISDFKHSLNVVIVVCEEVSIWILLRHLIMGAQNLLVILQLVFVI